MKIIVFPIFLIITAALGLISCHGRGGVRASTPPLVLQSKQGTLMANTAFTGYCREYYSPRAWRGTITYNYDEVSPLGTTAVTLNCKVFMKPWKKKGYSLGPPDYWDSHAACSYTYHYVWPQFEKVVGKGVISNGQLGLYMNTNPKACLYRLSIIKDNLPAVIHYFYLQPPTKKTVIKNPGGTICFGSVQEFPGNVNGVKLPLHFGPLVGKLSCSPWSRIQKGLTGYSGNVKFSWQLTPVLK